MDAAQTIRQSLSSVATLRDQLRNSKPLQDAVVAIKLFQARRFAGTYEDLLQSDTFAPPTRFFLEELYGVRDFAARDGQFARIAGALQSLFPNQVVATAVALAQLHALTERLDLEMAQQRLKTGHLPPEGPLSCRDYVLSWRGVATPAVRMGQLQSVLDIGQELNRLTRTKGLRMTLRMMRSPAKAAGLHALQSFLEAGFDTFASMGGSQGDDTQFFLDTIRTRESSWIHALYNSPTANCEADLAACLEKAVEPGAI
jgi:hypothetical protein